MEKLDLDFIFSVTAKKIRMPYLYSVYTKKKINRNKETDDMISYSFLNVFGNIFLI